MQKSKKRNLKSSKGITLIALVVTIVVLLILAGVSINAIFSDNGLIQRAKDAKESHRGGEIQEFVNLIITENKMAEYTNETKKTRVDVINDLHSQGKLTDDEVEELESTNIIKIGSITVDFSGLGSVSGSMTLGDVYTDEMIGKKISYSSNGQEDWIVFGKDSSGNILITTELPIDEAFEVCGTAEKWLSYEDDLDAACSGYGGTVQGVPVTSRSITMEDINYVIEFTEPTFDTYTFGATQDYEHKQVKCYYPSLDAASNSYWQNPTTNQNTFQSDLYGTYQLSKQPDYPGDDFELTYYNEMYYYWEALNGEEYYEGSLDYIKIENLKYVWGEDPYGACWNSYAIANKKVNVNPNGANFEIATADGWSVGFGWRTMQWGRKWWRRVF